MILYLYSYRIIALALFTLQWNAKAIQYSKAVFVNKCCGAGERLSENNDCIGDNSNNDWWPLILLVRKQSYFEPKGRAPQFVKPQFQHQPSCKNPDYYIGPHKVALYSNGTLFLLEKHKLIEPTNYCIDRDSAIICNSDVNLQKKLSKIRKCCGKNAVYKATDSSPCAPTNGLYSFNYTQYDVIFGFPECKVSKYIQIGKQFRESNLDVDSNHLVLDTGRKLEWQDFCIEYNVIDSEIAEEPHISIFTCADHLSISQNIDEYSYTDIRFILFPIGLLISVVFLLATLTIRDILPSNHHHILHLRCQTYYITSLLIGDLLLAFTHLLGRNVNGFTCISIAVCMHFFFLSAFFWLNTMCFNIYWTFRDFRPNSLERSQEKARLRIYKLYAWGVPLLITGCAATLDHMQKNSLTEDVYLQPGFCKREYWFAGDKEVLVYFYGPVGILLFVNLLLFASTARQLTCGLWKREEVKSTTKRTTLGGICMKLVIVMGVTWLADILSWAHTVWFGSPYYVWIVTDLINALQGVLIFIVIGCQPQVSSVLKQMWRSYDILKCKNIERGRQNSTSSQIGTMGESITNNTFITSNAKNQADTTC